MDPQILKSEDGLARILMCFEGTDKMFPEIKGEFSKLRQIMTSHSSIKQSKTQLGQILMQINVRMKKGLPSDIVVNPKNYPSGCCAAT